jgi:hypothetical protein
LQVKRRSSRSSEQIAEVVLSNSASSWRSFCSVAISASASSPSVRFWADSYR